MSNLQKTKLEKAEIINLFTSGCKPKNEHRTGIEYERIPIFNSTLKAADYYSENGICNLLRAFAREENWDYITDDYNIIGLKQGHDTITLEPGCQLELSIKPDFRIKDLKQKIENINKVLKPVLNKMDIILLNYGVSPLSTNKHIRLIPKKRYKLMSKYLWGILSDVMMRETAGIQACFDFENEEDAMEKFKISNKLVPFVTAMFANSPIRGGVETGYKSFRALSWLNTDNDRCGFVGQIDEHFSFEEYADYVLNTPMIFINRDSQPVSIKGKINFKEFMENGYEDYDAELDDFKLHANLYFPEVRLRNFIEIRNQDCVGKDLQYSILALYKGILYNNQAMNDINELLKQFSYPDFAELRYNVPKSALDTKVGKYFVKDIAKEILYISEKALIEDNLNEEKFLEPIKEYTLKGICPADEIIRNWYGIWNKDINKLVKFIS